MILFFKTKPILVFTFLFSMAIFAGEKKVANAQAASVSQEDASLAKEHFIRGKNFFNSKDFLQAVRHFKISYELVGSSDLLYNIGLCYEEMGDNKEAIKYYEKYVQDHSDESEKKEARQRIEALSDSAPDEEEIDSDIQLISYESTTGTSKDDPKTTTGINFELGGRMGPGFVVLLPRSDIPLNRHHYFGVDFLGDLFVSERLAFTALMAFAGYMEGSSPMRAREPTSHFALGLGLTMVTPLSEKIDFLSRLIVLPTFVSRANVSTRAIWLDFQVSLGLKINFGKRWAFLADFTGDIGPAFVVGSSSLVDWNPSLLLVLGARAGAVFKF